LCSTSMKERAAFSKKLDGQLQPASSQSRMLMAEVLWILLLFPSNISPEKKRENIRTVWAWSGESLDQNHPMLADSILGGLGSAGTAFNTYRWMEIAYLITLARAFKHFGPSERQGILASAKRFSTWLDGVPQKGHRQFRHILRHLLFPDEFERISSANDKSSIVATFTGLSKNEVHAHGRTTNSMMLCSRFAKNFKWNGVQPRSISIMATCRRSGGNGLARDRGS
jgi:5-methylcytosine-specific restriction protein B